MEAEKLSWEEIKRQYDQEWVELVDYDWPENEPYPSGGVVRVHSKIRREFDDLADRNPPVDSAYVFVSSSVRGSDTTTTRRYSRVILGQ